MYFLNEEQIAQRLSFLTEVGEAAREVAVQWDESSLVVKYAHDRVLHLAIECITDIGSLLIDGFILRDASSYEDIIDILSTEKAITAEITEPILELVRLRRPLAQDFAQRPITGLHPLIPRLPELLSTFDGQVRAFIKAELGR